MGQEWYYSQNSEKRGPVSGAELKALAASGKLKPTDMIWKEGTAKWLPAQSVKGLFPAATVPVPAAAVPRVPAAATAAAKKAAPGVAPARVEAVVEAQPAAGPRLSPAWLARWQGLPMPAKAGIIGGGAVLLLVVVAVPILLFAFFSRSPSSAPLAGQVQASDTKNSQSIEPVVDLETLITDYLADENAADAKYKGRVLRYAGGAWSVTGKTTNDTQVRFATSGHPLGVIANFAGQSRDEAWKRRKGQSIKFRGKCEGIERATITAIRIGDCEFEDVGSSGDEAKPVAEAGYQPGKLTRLDTYNLICQVTRNPDFKRSSFSGCTRTGQDGKRYVNLAQQVDYATWAKTFGEIAVEDFMDEDGNVLTKQPGAAWGQWTLQCSDGPLTVIGCVTEASQSPTKRKRVQITKVGLF